LKAIITEAMGRVNDMFANHGRAGREWTRRDWMSGIAGSGVAWSLGGWLSRLAVQAAESGASPKRSCILLWMNGGPSQTDTFDMKAGHAHGGPFQSIESRIPGMRLCEHLPQISQWTNRLALIRSMSTREGDHGRARQNLRTGYMPQGSIQFPVFGSVVSHEYAGRDADLPNYVSILPGGLFNPGVPAAGFLGPQHAPLLVDADGNADLAVQDLERPRGVSAAQMSQRMRLLNSVEQNFLAQRPGAAVDGHRSAYERAARMMNPSAGSALQLDEEPESVRERYGRSRFGRGCLLARRLVERGVPFVEVALGGWDTHDNNFESVRGLCAPLDQTWSALMQDLDQSGLLESTLIVWMGEFGRTPVINPRQGRDHYPRAWTVVLGGGGIQGGAIIGKTSGDGLSVEDRPVSTPDLLATICLALGLDPKKQNMSNVSRPIRLVDPAARPIHEVLS
jgi:hypothetical protein